MDTFNFERLWKNASHNIFRLEAIPEYSVEDDIDKFKKFYSNGRILKNT